MTLCVIVPSRGRPDNIKRLAEDFDRTSVDAELIVVCDDDDPELTNYPEWVEVGPRKRLGPTLNEWAVNMAEEFDYIGFMGDDHSPQSMDWDREVVKALRELKTGIVYGDDGFQGENLPTAAFMTSNIIRALGYMLPPKLIHLYVDNAWLSWGRGADCIRYLPNVKITHLHPVAGKAEWDERYAEVNSQKMYDDDRKTFEAYSFLQLPRDLQKIKALRA